MALRKQTATPAAPAAKTPVPAAPVSRSETKGSGTLTVPAKSAAPAAKAAPTYEQIAVRAYQIYLKRGFGPGSQESDWADAERQLRAGL